MMTIDRYVQGFPDIFLQEASLHPWEITDTLEEIIFRKLGELGEDYNIENKVAIHKTAIIEQGVALKGSIIISENCFIGANAYLRGPIFLGSSVKIGPSSEIKQSIVFSHSAIAHFNYVGNSILGSQVNLEAGSICANHYNERQDKRIFVSLGGIVIDTKTEKFGSIIGDNSRVGANAVLSPGTILEKNSVVKRLELIEQVK
ncbi:DapH/DapD/GlmU-related protein [Lunatibacter salilacus]|uniref:DapH/DapD/GlmU-related protein n=1 Tax=Lunatibacter salilacus TaxID=2483804 RepID=UPI00131E2D7C|nr:DapH/DapD/GlmU-related protein [Lunatibacter salilacus]